MTPLLSIVIANYNYGRFLDEAIQSVVSQNMGDKVELIICDGGSTDNSVDIIKKYANGLPPNTPRSEWHPPSPLTPHPSPPIPPPPSLISWWCSEEDKGQSDAFNKGFAHARGKYGCWLNADDVLLPGALMVILNYIERHPQAGWICGSSIFADRNLKVIWCSRCVRTWNIQLKKIPWYAVNGPSSFFLLENLKRVGGFDTTLRYTMDTDLWRRFVANGIRPCFVKNYIWCFRVHEESKTSHKFITGQGHRDFAEEGRSVNLKYGISPSASRIGGRLNKIFRLFSGTYLRSFFDTFRMKGKNVL